MTVLAIIDATGIEGRSMEEDGGIEEEAAGGEEGAMEEGREEGLLEAIEVGDGSVGLVEADAGGVA